MDIAIPVYAQKLPVPINGNLTKMSTALRALYGDCYMIQRGRHIVYYTDGKVCDCQRCGEHLEVLVQGLDELAGIEHDWLEFQTGMIICPDCGNKRCPRAADHRQDCTKSNEPGQIGSSYP